MELQTCGKPIDALLERVLCMNILSSDYFKELYRLKTYHEVIDEIYNQVDHVEPWMTGNCRGPSSAFCLLYKCFTMKLTVKQVQGLLDHGDSPYIRAVGFLYLRYFAEPKSLWGWFEPYLKDPEEFSPGSSGKMTTMGMYIRDLLLGQYYFDSLFPRIPVLIMRQITTNLENMKLPTQPSGVAASANRFGSEDGARRPPSVKAALSVSFGQRAPHRTSTRDSSPVRRTTAAPADKEREKNRDRDRESERDRDRDRERERARVRDRERDRDRERERDRDRERERDRDRGREKERDRERGRDSRDRDHERDRRRHSKSRSRSPHRRDRDYSPRGRDSRDRDREDRGQERDRRHRDDRDGDYKRRDRSRSPQDRSPSEKETKSGTSSKLQSLKELYGDGKTDENDRRYVQKNDSTTEDVVRIGGSSWR